MSVYLVMIGSEEKHSQTNPDIVGPFPSRDAAQEFADSPAIEAWLESERLCFGGWPTCHIVCDDTATDPGAFAAQFDEDVEIDPNSPGYLAGQAAADRQNLAAAFAIREEIAGLPREEAVARMVEALNS